jgi:2-polyprenyl-6-hydroxyphenyl methylase/3-demethylubiquinone-9 3-methyltransferase
MNTDTQKFDAFAHDDWWGADGRLNSLQKINPLRFGYFSKIAGETAGGLGGKLVLDVGCGGGILAESFARAGAHVTGIDLSPVAIESARAHAKASGLKIEYRTASPAELKKSRPKKFDVIVCAEVLEHLSSEDLDAFLADTLGMLKKGGLLFFGTINRTLKARLLAIFIAENILKMLPGGTHSFDRFIKPSELVRSLLGFGLTVEELKGMSYDPLKLEFKLTNDTSVNYLGYARKG